MKFQFEERFETVVGTEMCRSLGFEPCAVIAGYRPEFPISNMDPNLEFIIESDKKTFWNKMQEKYPGDDQMPKFMGRLRRNLFVPLDSDDIPFIGQ